MSRNWLTSLRSLAGDCTTLPPDGRRAATPNASLLQVTVRRCRQTPGGQQLQIPHCCKRQLPPCIHRQVFLCRCFVRVAAIHPLIENAAFVAETAVIVSSFCSRALVP